MWNTKACVLHYYSVWLFALLQLVGVLETIICFPASLIIYHWPIIATII